MSESTPLIMPGAENDPLLTQEVLNGTEGNELDVFTPGTETVPAAAAPETLTEFEAFIGALGLQHFTANEFLFMGGSNASGGCAGRNGPPPRNLWDNIVPTAKLLDKLRARLGTPIRLTSIYRNQSYNSCIGGEPGSFHMKFNAADFQTSGNPRDWANVLLEMRAAGVFRGGVGLYNTFVHVDTRGNNATWGF